MKEYKVIGCISACPKGSVFYEPSEAFLFTDYTRRNNGTYAATMEGIQHLIGEQFPLADIVLTSGGETVDGQLWDVCILQEAK